MKSSLCLAVASAVLATAGPLRKRALETEWVYDVVTVTVTADPQPSVFVANTKPKPTTEAPAPAPPPPAAAAAKEPETTQAPPPPPVETTQAPPPPPKTEPEPEPEPQPEPKPEPTQPSNGGTEKVPVSGSYQQVVLDQHNLHRKNHSSPDLKWSDELAQYAKNTAEGCVFEHDMNQGAGGYGQNLASYGSSSNGGSDSDAIARAITTQWYDGEYGAYASFFGMANPPSSSFGAYGHLTQLVWKDSTEVGCYTARCPAGTVLGMESSYSVCNYNPPGNYAGQYGKNVLAPLGLSIAIL